MPSVEEWKNMVHKGIVDARKTEEAYVSNPSSATNPTGRKHYRTAGVPVLLIGVALTVGNYVGYLATGRAFVIFIATNIVFVGAGLWMVITGKNPFVRFPSSRRRG